MKEKQIINQSFKLILLFFAISLAGCNNKNRLTDINAFPEDDDATPVNIIEQALPTIMVIPSDQLLKKFDALKTIEMQGKKYLLRDYTHYLLSNDDNKAIIAEIQKKFIEMGYPLSDLEQELKSLNNQESLDEADNLVIDPKTQLLATISPDMIIELDYTYKLNINSRDLRKKLTYTINIIDTYTNKIVSSLSQNELQGNNVPEIMKKSLDNKFKIIAKDIKDNFANTIIKGREITVRIGIENTSNISLKNENIQGETYADWIIDYMKIYAKKGTYKLQRNTAYELFFENVRISPINKDGTQFNAYDWAKEFCKALYKECGVKATNNSQGLGEVSIIIKGIQ